MRGLADLRRAAAACLQLARRKPERVREGRAALAHPELAVDGVLESLRASDRQLVAPRLDDGLITRRPLEVDRGTPVASTPDGQHLVSTRSARSDSRRRGGGGATPGILEGVDLHDDRRFRAGTRRCIEDRGGALLPCPLCRRARPPRLPSCLRHAKVPPAVLGLADARALGQAELLTDLRRDELVLARPARVGSAGLRCLGEAGRACRHRYLPINLRSDNGRGREGISMDNQWISMYIHG